MATLSVHKITTEQILKTIDEYFEKKRTMSNWYSGENPTEDEAVTADRLLAENSCRWGQN